MQRDMSQYTRLIVLIFLISVTKVLSAQIVDIQDNLVHPFDGPVTDIAVNNSESTAFISGDFNVYNPRFSNGGKLVISGNDINNFSTSFDFPYFDSEIRDFESDQNGGWFVAVSQTATISPLRSKFVYVNANNEIDDLEISISNNSTIFSMEYFEGKLYFFGNFSFVNGLPRSGAACIDVLSGVLTDWNPQFTSSFISTITMETSCVFGDNVYISGSFQFVDGNERNGLAGFDMNTGELIDWTFDLNNEPVKELIVTEEKAFALTWTQTNTVNVYDGDLFVLDMTTGTIETVHLAGRNDDMELVNDDLYIGGEDGIYIYHVEAGLEFIPHYFTGVVYCLKKIGEDILVCGNFHTIDNQKARNAIIMDIATNDLTFGVIDGGEYGNLYGIKKLEYIDGELMMGGRVTNLGGIPVTTVAQIDLTTGELLPMEIQLTGMGKCLAINNAQDTLYIGGYLGINNSVFAKLIAVNLNNGSYQIFGPTGNFTPNEIEVGANRIYVTGNFSSLSNNQSFYILNRSNLTNLPLPSGYNFSGITYIAKEWNGYIVLSGDLSDSEGLTRDILFLNALTFEESENLQFTLTGSGAKIESLFFTDSLIYFGGQFSSVNSQPGIGLAIYDFIDNEFEDYGIQSGGYVKEIILYDSLLILGGNLSLYVNGQSQKFVNIYNRYSGETYSTGATFYNSTGSFVSTMEIFQDRLIFGGEFTFNTDYNTFRKNCTNWKLPPVTPQLVIDGTSIATYPSTISITASVIGNPVIESFNWYYSPDNGSNWFLIQNGGIYSGAQTQQLSIEILNQDFDGYIYYCEAIAGDLILISNEFSISVVLALSDFDSNKISVFPNPTENFLTITSEVKIDLIELINPMGELLWLNRGNGSQTLIRTAEYSPGMYYLRLYMNNQILTKKIVVQ